MPRSPRSAHRPSVVIDEGAAHQYYTAIPNTVIRGLKSRDLSVYAKWLYVYLKSVCGDGGVCYRSTTTIALEAGISRGEVSKAKQELRQQGLILVHEGKNPHRDADHVRIRDIWPLNMEEFSVHMVNTEEDGIAKEIQGESPESVHIVNTKDDQCSYGERSVHMVNQRRSLEEDPLKKERYSLLSEESVAQGKFPLLNGVVQNTSVTFPYEAKKRPKVITPLPDDDWLREQLLIYRADFDFDALNDDEWWANTANSFPEFSPQWVTHAFASLARWLSDNRKRAPRTPRGWKQRMNFSLNWYYDKHMRRQAHGGPTPRHRGPSQY